MGELDSILVGPVCVGKNRFTFEAPAPDPKDIPNRDLLDVTVVLLTCSYRDEEFIRIGYYVHNEYEEQIDLEDASLVVDPEKIKRNILADKPRVTRFNIAWDNDADRKDAQQNGHIDEEDEELDEDDEDEEEDEDDEDDDEDGEEDLCDTEDNDEDADGDTMNVD